MTVLLEWIRMPMSVCKTENFESVCLDAPFVFTGRTDLECSLVCPTDRVPQQVLCREDGWRLFRVTGTLEFSLIGILAQISGVLAEAKIGIFVVSTYDTDYVMVKADKAAAAEEALRRAGYDWKETL